MGLKQLNPLYDEIKNPHVEKYIELNCPISLSGAGVEALLRSRAEEIAGGPVRDEDVVAIIKAKAAEIRKVREGVDDQGDGGR